MILLFLLQRKIWVTPGPCNDVCNEYINYIRKFKVRNIEVFDGYSLSSNKLKNWRASEQNKEILIIREIHNRRKYSSINKIRISKPDKSWLTSKIHRGWISSPACWDDVHTIIVRLLGQPFKSPKKMIPKMSFELVTTLTFNRVIDRISQK